MGKTSSWGVIERNGEFLFIERSAKTSRAGQWCPPGGSRKKNESPEAACIREVKEEIGLDVECTGLILQDESFYYFSCTVNDATQAITLKSNECASYRWVKPNDVLTLGVIMEFKRMKRLFSILGQSIVVSSNRR